MTTFYICRHGETENNRLQRFSGWIDTPLTEAGEQNAVASAVKLSDLHPEAIVSSDLGRTFITAYIIAGRIGFDHEISRAKDLREVNYGDLANRPHSEYPKLTPEENTDFAPPNGESLAQMQRRVLTYVRQLAADNPDKTMLIVAHDGTINAIRSDLTGESMGIADLTHNAHDFVARFTVENGRVTSFAELKS